MCTCDDESLLATESDTLLATDNDENVEINQDDGLLYWLTEHHSWNGPTAEEVQQYLASV